jgi:hypothetical protein
VNLPFIVRLPVVALVAMLGLAVPLVETRDARNEALLSGTPLFQFAEEPQFVSLLEVHVDVVCAQAVAGDRTAARPAISRAFFSGFLRKMHFAGRRAMSIFQDLWLVFGLL